MFNVREYQAEQRALREFEAQSGRDAGADFADNPTRRTLETALQNEVNKIRAMPTREERVKYKQSHFLQKWLPLIEDYFAQEARYQNNAVGYALAYLFDTGNIEQALNLADRAIKDGQKMPEQFKTTVEQFTANSMLDWAAEESGQARAVEPYFSQVLQAVCTEWNVHDFARAKWLKLTAHLLLTVKGKVHAASVNEPKRLLLAIDLLYKAFELNRKSGVLSLIERCNMRLTALEKQGLIFKRTPTQRGELTISEKELDFRFIADLLSTPPLSFKQVIEQQAKNV